MGLIKTVLLFGRIIAIVLIVGLKHTMILNPNKKSLKNLIRRRIADNNMTIQLSTTNESEG
jgi:hypothetical protein